jgi:hypothetical protein
MGRGPTVYNFRHTVLGRSFHVHPGCAEARSIFPLYRVHLRSSPGAKKLGFYSGDTLSPWESVSRMSSRRWRGFYDFSN